MDELDDVVPRGQMSLWTSALPQEDTGDLILRVRRRAGWSQERLAAAIGIHRSSLSRVETGRRVASYDEVLAIGEALGIAPRDLLGDSKPGARRHRRSDTLPSLTASAELAGRLCDRRIVREFLSRGGSGYALSDARRGRQPLSARQAAIALAVLDEWRGR